MNMYENKRELTDIEKELVVEICHEASLGLSDWVEDLLKSDLFDIYDIEAMLCRALKEVTRVCNDASK